MNGEVSELCALTACARAALKCGGIMKYALGNYINSEKFVFLPQKTEIVEDSAQKWFERLRVSGLNDIFMLLPQSADGRMLHVFSNSSGGCVVCRFNSGGVTYFTSRWYFDNEKRGWNVEFFESEWDSAPEEKPVFEDNSVEFEAVLADIAVFAEKINEHGWANVFRQARVILNGECECRLDWDNIPAASSDIPETNRRIYCAAAKADVFGGMGSWNDSPLWHAGEMGLSDEYKRLSDALFVQMQRALLFAVNDI